MRGLTPPELLTLLTAGMRDALAARGLSGGLYLTEVGGISV